ncbi:ABC transporter permease [Paraburkholderia caballeronis]|uniref:NitT/TauT family transport system permease protein n=1 Tax=Paraburkholderia caballeronis TaxID=416943 RepID=A0A1H7P4Y0_9BURK|nr:ABC transporter permease subunit [Paraburkholderia caballeronis]PXW25398.1 NitT/TauT family transport system permease protein [Paraburkholderia caballeronis]PXX01005.1 NitT/TauT family transport system permease protein [Paraburkholderia caballeronis]RAJ99642.1 NitT/TauT family transport system permease protein [Paraburkholderia caballeronis]TDV34040.1 NitT/TauT family transport system permease protein [Paraburkholderia caballeronis]SEE39018.1 NitT/TauT family transport system permease prote
MSIPSELLDSSAGRPPRRATPLTRANARRIGVAALAAAAWLASAAITVWWPDLDDWPYTNELVALKLAIALLAALIGAAGWRRATQRDARQRPARIAAALAAALDAAPWLLALALGIAAWEIVTAKLEWLPRPFFAPPQALIAVYFDDFPRLASSVVHSFGLLAYGYLLGAAAGFAIGVSIGWSRAVGYWLHPVLRLVGPLPATAWLPLAFFFFPSSFSASVFLIALATAFPVAVLTWSGVASVNSAYYDVARTLGARPSFLILRVAIPAALPSVFVGLFMGLGASFSVLIVAEMMGVKAGLGWYLQWAQGWAAYSNMYAALLVMAAMCSGLITLLFRLRDRLLVWQKGLLKW